MIHPKKPFRYLSVCSGMEAASVAWEPLGWTPAGFSEIEPFPSAILKHRFPNIPNYGDLTKYNEWPIEPGTIDLIVGGTPCQAWSVAGKRMGFEDPRGRVALAYVGLIERIKPRWIVWENVPGVYSAGNPRGSDFAAFTNQLVKCGYHLAYRTLNAVHFGVPQRRRRCILVGCLTGWESAAAVLFEPESLRRDLKKKRTTGEDPAANASTSPGNGLQQTVGTLCADTHPGAYSGQDAYTGRLIPAVLQTTPFTVGVDFRNGTIDEKTSQTLASKPCGGWSVNFIGGVLEKPSVIPIQDGREMEKHQNGIGVGNPGDPSYTVDTTGSQSVAIPFCKSKRASSPTDNETWVAGDTANTLNNFDLGDTRTTAAIVSPMPTVIDRAAFNQGINAQYDPQIEQTQTCPTIVSKGPHAVQVPCVTGETTHCLTKSYHSSEDGTGRRTPIIPASMAVRRLTPIECERLQGFPDNWTQIPWKGKPAEECPDGPRYKACGNSMAVPVMAWVGRRIAELEEDENA